MPAPRAQANINLAAIERNCQRLRAELRPGSQLCAVVKADGYGHGAAQSARAALAGGAGWLAVACAAEAADIRGAGIDDVPLLVMGALNQPELEQALLADADVVVWHERDVQAVAAAGGGRVHVKLDSGMGRLGTRDPEEASRVVSAVNTTGGVELAGLMSHFATADELNDRGFFAGQLEMFAAWARAAEGRASGDPRACRQQRSTAAGCRRAVRHGQVRDRRLWHGPLRRGSRGPGTRARPRARRPTWPR